MGKKLVPVNRFNLEPAKPSSAFSTIAASPVATNFLVLEHPVVHSINLDAAAFAPVIIREYFPLIETTQTIDKDSSFNDYNYKDVKLVFPEIEIKPDKDTLFYYENIFDATTGNITGFLGKVTLTVNLKNKPLKKVNEVNIDIQLKEAILNLKVKHETTDVIETVRINGTITNGNTISFAIIGEAVKIAFTNMMSRIDELKNSVDLFFDFKAYYKAKKNILVARNMAWNRSFTRIATPMIINEKTGQQRNFRSIVKDIQTENKLNTDVQEEFVKSTFILKFNKILEYPIGTGYYKTSGGIVTSNPFNLNPDFSQFRQIFVPGVNFNKLSVYKSVISPNTFLLISKVYCLTRTNDTMQPCISTVFHLYDDGAPTTEEVSKITFDFAIGPDLSEFDLAKLKIDLHTYNFLDTAALGSSNYLDNITFQYPNDLDAATFEISGNHFLQTPDIVKEGTRFQFKISTTNLNDASLFINALNNSISQYANLNFRHKEIKDTSIIEINIEKTVGEIIFPAIDNTAKKITLENKSISKCRLNAVLCIDANNAPYFNSNFFMRFPLLNSMEIKDLFISDLHPDSNGNDVNKVYFDFESIESISSEFSQVVSQSTDYYRSVTINILKQKPAIAKIQIELMVNATGNKFNVEKLKSEFSTPVLFNFILLNNLSNNTLIAFKTNYFDQNGNMVGIINSTFDFSTSATINIIKLK